jgi:glycerol-3-phosphate O-acyltransferase
VWPLSWLIRTMGAYFIRRRSDRPLYRRVLARYVQMATAEGVTQAIFPEGGLSLTGKTMPPRLGILSYILQADQMHGRDVVFVPVALNYDRIVEDRVLIEADKAGVRRFRAPVLSIAAFIWRHLWRALLGRFRGFGTAAVRFGAPVSLKGFSSSCEGDVTAALAEHLMRKITQLVPVLPVPLVSAAWGPDPATTRAALIARVQSLADDFAARGAGMMLPQGGGEAAVDMALAIFRLRKFVTGTDEALVLNPERREVLDFYAASVLQLADASAETLRPKKPRTAPVRQRERHKITKE